MMRASYKGAILVSAIVLATAGPLFAQGPSCDESTILALEISGELVAPVDVANQVTDDLAVIRDAYPVVASITVWPDWEPGRLKVRLTPSAWAQYLAGTYTALDTLNEEYGMAVVDQIAFINVLVLASAVCSNPTVIEDAYATAAGVEWAAPNWYLGDGDDITSTHVGRYTFKHGWLDCAVGCAYEHYWQFEVNNGVATLVGEYGDEVSEEVNTFGAVKAQFR